jgi:ABC-type Fe3+ transport system permease subunit
MRTVRTSYRTLGILWLVYGAICIFEAAWLVVERNVLRIVWGTLITRVPDSLSWMSYYDMIWFVAVALAIMTAIFSFFGAFALMRRVISGRPFAQIASILAIIHGPLGVALGVYTLVCIVPNAVDEGYSVRAAA